MSTHYFLRQIDRSLPFSCFTYTVYHENKVIKMEFFHTNATRFPYFRYCILFFYVV